MKALLFVLLWVGLALGVVLVAMYSTRPREEKPTYKGNLPGGLRIIIFLAAAFLVVGLPAAVLSKTNDRLPSGAGTYTIPSTESQRQGRLIFRETCASCHTLSAANARGVYGPDLDTQFGPGADPKTISARVLSAIKTGGATGKQMPANLLSGNDAKLVSQYVADVAGK
jgi:mono/diheme cytochrome c family protein